jgi:hypothetical protein
LKDWKRKIVMKETEWWTALRKDRVRVREKKTSFLDRDS